ncbi:hypothetical protein A3K86_14365 [Photobacterium jeanii]|uniref:Uncharacterized protein n=1 Tax=Photobacterium jeanii TaxID=858640 RepID=A0A178KAN6_9GAMM|nr:hypothetical protein A3K86_14365 [Photobacterium jeanii]PST88864.1 hypothetical protein C9I91_16230 [Photobacterium jeanii]
MSGCAKIALEKQARIQKGIKVTALFITEKLQPDKTIDCLNFNMKAVKFRKRKYSEIAQI